MRANNGSSRAVQTALTSVTALGIVFGDIGTSPLYALKEAVKAAGGGAMAPPGAVLGVLSLVLWSLFLIISVKYAILILRADNNGEGGILALLALVSPRRAKANRLRSILIILGLVGAALLYGDGAITPAISVLSAIEGLKVYAPQLESLVIPLTVAILVVLFVIQRKGTEWVGNIFGPVMLLWFLTIAILGIRGVMMQPRVLLAINPYYAVRYLIDAGPVTLAVVGAVFLAVTGGEALYADLGHFGRVPMRLAWFVVALPCLVLNYLGQGGLLLTRPEAIENPFYELAPQWTHYGLVIFATAATVIASQAIISGAYSLTQQAVQLGFLPRVRVVHTASHERGQIYVPSVNFLLAVTTIAAVVGFGSSDALAGAYGVAVSLLMAITTLMATIIALRWRFNPWIVFPVNGAFLLIDLVFFGANSLKILEGGWFPLLLAAVIAFVMITWRQGQEIARQARMKLRPSVEEFIQQLKADPPYRIRGAGIFLSSAKAGVPLLLTHHLQHNHVLHQQAFLVCAVTDPRPRVPPEERVEVTASVEGIQRLFVHFGFMETPDVPEALSLAAKKHAIGAVAFDQASYYIGRETIIPGERWSGMARWREILFAWMNRNAERSGAYFRVPSRQVVEIGIEIEI